MSLTATDLRDIRAIMREEIRDKIQGEVPKIVREGIEALVPDIVRKIIGEEVPVIVMQITHAEVPPIIRGEVKRQVGPLEGRLMAVENDVKEIYFMMSDLQQRLPTQQTQS